MSTILDFDKSHNRADVHPADLNDSMVLKLKEYGFSITENPYMLKRRAIVLTLDKCMLVDLDKETVSIWKNFMSRPSLV